MSHARYIVANVPIYLDSCSYIIQAPRLFLGRAPLTERASTGAGCQPQEAPELHFLGKSHMCAGFYQDKEQNLAVSSLYNPPLSRFGFHNRKDVVGSSCGFGLKTEKGESKGACVPPAK